jgi:hypothetical protein
VINYFVNTAKLRKWVTDKSDAEKNRFKRPDSHFMTWVAPEKFFEDNTLYKAWGAAVIDAE